jgi:hypothetical protein
MGFLFNTSTSTTNHGLITTSDTERFRITSNGTFLTGNSSAFTVSGISTGITSGTGTINFVGGTIGIGTSSPSNGLLITDKKIFKFLRGYKNI